MKVIRQPTFRELNKQSELVPAYSVINSRVHNFVLQREIHTLILIDFYWNSLLLHGAASTNLIGKHEHVTTTHKRRDRRARDANIRILGEVQNSNAVKCKEH